MSDLEQALAGAGNGPVLVVSDASTDVERRLLLEALEALDRPVDHVPIDDAAVSEKLSGGDTIVVAIRVAWLPDERRRVGLRHLLTLENPRQPRERTQARLVDEAPHRYRVVAGTPARVEDLRRRWRRDTGGTGGPEAFIRYARRQGALALDRAERRLIGQRYKVPRLVVDEIFSSRRFRDEVTELARTSDRPVEQVMEEAHEALHEVVASQSRVAMDAFDAVTGPLFRRAWDIDVDASSLDRLHETNREKGLVFLPAHRSYVDPLVLAHVLTRAGFPRNHLPGGNNLAFWPLGPIARRTGVIFIPRTLKGDDVTKLVLREYFGFLAAKRFNLEWYMEAGRARTGKLRPPRFGLLQFVVDAMHSGRTDDVGLVPVSITYDWLPEVRLMAAEEQGAPKQPEGIGWLARYIRANNTKLGSVHVRFGEPLSLRDGLERARERGADDRLALQKVGFEVFHRINAVTPITPMALVTLALLGAGGRALTDVEVVDAVAPLVGYVDRRDLTVLDRSWATELTGVRRTLSRLEAAGIVSRYGEGTTSVFSIEPGQHHSAAFYRNSAIHWFVNRAIVEVAIALEIEDPGDEPIASAWRTCLDLRDLLKFEFFFSDKRDFYDELQVERAVLGIGDDADLPTTPAEARGVLRETGFLAAPIVLRPFLEAQWVVTDQLASQDPRRPVEEKAFIAECTAVGRQYLLQQRLHHPESVSPELFASALRLARNRDLVDPGRDALRQARRELADEVARALHGVDEVELIDRERRGTPRRAGRR